MAEKLSAPAALSAEKEASPQDRLDQLSINTIRTLAIDGVEKAKSGHPGMPMGAAAMAYVLWTRFLRHNPRNPQWPNRDRFVLIGGPRLHAALRAAAPHRIRSLARRLEAVPAVGQPHSGASRARPHAGRGGDHRPAGTGLRQRRGHGHRGAVFGGPISTGPALRWSTTSLTPFAATAT